MFSGIYVAICMFILIFVSHPTLLLSSMRVIVDSKEAIGNDEMQVQCWPNIITLGIYSSAYVQLQPWSWTRLQNES